MRYYPNKSIYYIQNYNTQFSTYEWVHNSLMQQNTVITQLQKNKKYHNKLVSLYFMLQDTKKNLYRLKYNTSYI